MNKRRWSRGEKWMIVLSCGVCLPGLLLGWIYERQNELPPAPSLVEEVPPVNNAFDVLMATSPSVTEPRYAKMANGACKTMGAVVDREFDCNWGEQPHPYTSQYNRTYPLKNKLAYLQANTASLKTWRASLSLPLYVPDDLPRAQRRLWGRCVKFGVLARTQARAYWQRGDNDGAVDWLLAWHRDWCRQTLSFYNGRNHPVTLDLIRGLDYGRQKVGDELEWLMPYLNAPQLQRASLGLQQNRRLVPSRVEAAIQGKKRGMPRVYRACATNSFKGFDEEFGASWVNSLWKQRFRWANKKVGFARIEKQWDWIIAGEEAPLQAVKSQNLTQLDFEENDPFRLLEPYRSNLQRFDAASRDAPELVLLTAMAARSFALEHGRNPRNLNELVPRYLWKVEFDPFNAPHPLCYNSKQQTYLQSQLNSDGESLPRPNVPKSPLIRTRKTLPFLLYSVGLNCRDQGGMNFKSADETTPVPATDDIFSARSVVSNPKIKPASLKSC